MPKYCRVYRTMCTCMTCLEKECGYSDRTRIEAEAIHGVRLTREGKEVPTPGAAPTDAGTPTPPGRPAATGGGPGSPQRNPGAGSGVRPLSTTSLPPSGSAPHRLRPAEMLVIAAASITVVLLVAAPVMAYYFLVLKPDRGERDAAATIEPDEAPWVAAVEPPALPAAAEVPGRAETEAPQDGALTAAPPAAQREETPAEALDRVLSGFVAQRQATATPAAPQGRPAPRRNISPAAMENLNALRLQGNEAREAGDLLAARHFYEQTVKENPQYFEGMNNLANTYSDLGDLDGAQPLYLRGLRVDPHSSHLHFNLGINHYRAGNYTEAYRSMVLVLDLNPDDVEALLLAGLAAFQLEQYMVAAHLFDQMVRKDPESAVGFFNLAVVYNRLGEGSLSRTYLARARELDPLLVRTNGRQSISQATR